MNPTVLAWCLAQPVDNQARGLADAYLSGALRVTANGSTIEYRSQAELIAAAGALYAATSGQGAVSPRGPSVTYARFSRGAG